MLLPLRGPVRETPSPFFGGGVFLKPFKTIDEQIQLLKDRGLIINDEVAASKYLLSNNYYNIINGYSKYFPMCDDKYTGETSFDEVRNLYLLDSELKQIFFKSILTAESHLKAIFAYRFAEKFPDIPYAYLDIYCYSPDKTLNVVNTIHKLSGIINNHQYNKNSSIAHYLNQYGNVPIWVLINHIDFGQLRYMLQNSQTILQNKVARDFMEFIKQNIPNATLFAPEMMIAFLANINEVRNVCAHNNRLVGFRCKKDDKYWADLHSKYMIKPNDERRDPYSVFLSLQCFLSKPEYILFHNTLRKRMNYFKTKFHSIDYNLIFSELGFPNDWCINTPKIPQD